MPLDLLAKHRPDFDRAIEFLKTDIASLRTGRANPALVENITVEAYGAKTALKGLASITIPDARAIVIDPWDKSILKDIEKAIHEAKLGLSPAVQGQVIRIALPALTEESRKNLLKVLGEKLENSRVAVRSVRDKARADIMAAEKSKQIAEDEKYKLLEQLDKTAADYNEKIKRLGMEKEREIMTI